MLQLWKQKFRKENGGDLLIVLMRNHERAEVQAFVDRAMQKAYGCSAYPLSDCVFLARRMGVEGKSGKLCGAISLALDRMDPLPIETVYDFRVCRFPEGCLRGNIVEFGRWAAEDTDAAKRLLYAAIVHAICLGFHWGISEVKPGVARRFGQMGLRLHLLGAELIPERVPSKVANYYFIPPKPSVCVLHLPEAAARLRGLGHY